MVCSPSLLLVGLLATAAVGLGGPVKRDVEEPGATEQGAEVVGEESEVGQATSGVSEVPAEVGEVLAEAVKVVEAPAEASEVGEVLAEAVKVVEVPAEVGEVPAEAVKVVEVSAEASEVGVVPAEASETGEVPDETDDTVPEASEIAEGDVEDGEKGDLIDFIPEVSLEEAAAEGVMANEPELQGEEVPSGELLVQEMSPFCQYSRDIITCDFIWAEKTVYLAGTPQVAGPLKVVSIQNVQHLKIDRWACFDLLLQDVMQAQVVGQDVGASCTSGTLLALHNVVLDSLPGKKRVFNISSSKITEALVTSVDNFAISGSEIQRLRVEETIENEVQVTLHEVHLGHLERLHLAPKASVSFEKSTVGEVPEGALVLAASGNVLSEVKFLKGDESPPASVLLKGGADLILTDVSGSLRIVAEECPSSQPCPKAPSDDISSIESPKCSTTDDYWSVMIIVLVLSLFLNLLQMVFNQPCSILARFANTRKPTPYNSLKTRQEQRCFSQQELESFPVDQQELWKDTTVQEGLESSHHALQVTINDVDEVLLGLRRRTIVDIPSDKGTLKSSSFTEGEVERLDFLDPNCSDHPHTDLDFEGHGDEAKGKNLQPNHWASEGQYLQVPRCDESFTATWGKGK